LVTASAAAGWRIDFVSKPGCRWHRCAAVMAASAAAGHRRLQYEARAKLLISLTEYMDDLKEKIAMITEADTPQKRSRRITKLSNSPEIIDSLLKDESVYAGYCRWFVAQQEIYSEAKSVVANR